MPGAVPPPAGLFREEILPALGRGNHLETGDGSLRARRGNGHAFLVIYARSMGALYGAFQAPRSFLARRRLMVRLDSLRDLAIVRAPTGYGKSVAVAQWADAQPRSGVWLSVNSENSSRAPFWVDVVRRLVQAGLLPADDPQTLTLGDIAPDTDLREALRSILGQLRRPALLVIDDAYRLDDALIAQDLVEFVTSTPLEAVVIARTQGTPGQDWSVTAAEPLVITAQELVFSVDEIAELLGDDARAPHVGALLEKTGGIPLLARAIAENIRVRSNGAIRRGDTQDAVARVLHSLVFHSGLADDTVGFALRTSIPDRIDAALAEAITGRKDAAELFDDFEQRGLGAWFRRNDSAWFSYTPGVRDLLRGKAAKLPRTEARRIHATISRYTYERDMAIPAIARAIAAGDLDFAEIAVARYYWLYTGFQWQTVEALLSTVSMPAMRNHPVLAIAMALLLGQFARNRVRTLEYMAIATTGKRLGPGTPPLHRALVATIQAGSMRSLGQEGRARAAARRADAALHEIDPDEVATNESLIAILYGHTGITYLHTGAVDRAIELFEEGALLRSRTMRGPGQVLPNAMAAGVLAAEGRLVEAREHVEVARQLGGPETGIEDWHHRYQGAHYWIAEALLALDAGEVEAAQSFLHEVDRHLHTIEFWPAIALTQAHVDRQLGDPLVGAAAIEAMMRPGARPTTTGYLHDRLHIARAALLLEAGRIAEARTILSSQSTANWDAAIATAQLHLATGQPQRALAVLAEKRAARPSTRAEIDALLLESVAADRLGHSTTARAAASRAEALKRAAALHRPLLFIPNPVAAAIALTERERVLLVHLGSGASRGQIADDLVVSPNTVKSQLRVLYKKLDAGSRDEALQHARDAQLI